MTSVDSPRVGFPCFATESAVAAKKAAKVVMVKGWLRAVIDPITIMEECNNLWKV